MQAGRPRSFLCLIGVDRCASVVQAALSSPCLRASVVNLHCIGLRLTTFAPSRLRGSKLPRQKFDWNTLLLMNTSPSDSIMTSPTPQP